MNKNLVEFAQTVGISNVIVEPADCARYNADGRGETGAALAVIRPRSTHEVSACVRIARSKNLQIVPQGGRSGLVEAGLANGQLVISLERLTERVDIDPVNRSATVSAGVLLSTVNNAAAQYGLCFPIDLGADPSIGGMVASNTGGARFLRYGDVRRNLLGLEVVLGDDEGTVVTLGKGLWKDNSALDLKQMIVSSAGSLGIVTAATLTLQHMPGNSITAMIALRSADFAIDLLMDLERQFGPLLSAYEGISPEVLELVRDSFERINVPFPGLQLDYAVLVELSAPFAVPNEDLLNKLYDGLLPHMAGDGPVLDAVVDEGGGLWAVRHAIPEALSKRGRVIGCDVAMRRGELVKFRRRARAQIQDLWPNLMTADFGHIGDGGLHFNLVGSKDAPSFDEIARDVRDLVYNMVVNEFGGSFSAEHGIGPRNISYYHAHTPQILQAISGKIQQAFSPYGLGRVSFCQVE